MLLDLLCFAMDQLCSRDGLWTDTGLDLLVSDKGVAAATCGALAGPLLLLMFGGWGLES